MRFRSVLERLEGDLWSREDLGDVDEVAAESERLTGFGLASSQRATA
jgi:hypothetical protein